MTEVRVTIHEDGRLEFIYSDALVGLLALGDSQTKRASHVEPHPSKNGWLADMMPSGGPVLGANGTEGHVPHKDCDCQTCEGVVESLTPFETRAEALAAEVEWLKENRGL